MRIDTIKKEYIPPLLSLEQGIFGESAWHESGFLSEVENDNALFFVALDGEQVLGCAAANLAADTAFISKVMVAPDRRREGIGRTLLTHLCESAEKRGAREVTLEVRVSNSAAIALYTALGFENLGKRSNFYRNPKEDAVIMTKVLC